MLEAAQVNECPMISILMPAYNEEMVIGEALQGLLQLNYPMYEVLVIDDGSSDHTVVMAQEIASRYPQVSARIISQVNAGKAHALNFGMIQALGDLVVCVDADSRLHPDTLTAGASHFRDPKVAAVGGFVEVANRNTLLLKCQYLEYLISLQFVRRTLSLFGVVTVVPGPIGMFRKSALLGIGGYSRSRDTFAEDAELTIRLLAEGWRIESDENMISYTEAPEDIPTLLRQRYRWIRGMYQASWDNLITMVGNGKLRCTGLGIYLIFETTFLPIANVFLLVATLSYFFTTGNIFILGVWMIYTAIIELLRMIMAFANTKAILENILLILPRKLFYDHLLQIWALFCLIDEWRSQSMTWDKLERTGNLGTKGAS